MTQPIDDRRHRTPDNDVTTHDRPLIMGILNVTPDSFSDGGRHDQLDAAIAHAKQMIAEGADLIDVGGESTRPGSEAVGDDEQIRRTVPVIQQMVAANLNAWSGRPIQISIDTMSAAVAAAAVQAGATMINDVSAGLADPRMFDVAATTNSQLVLMHMRGRPKTMQREPIYDDVVGEVEAFLLNQASAAQRAGVDHDRILLDPGIGFGKTREHNLELLAALPRFATLGYPLLLGTSRKRFMGSICTPPGAESPPAPVALVGATCATTALGVAAGVTIFRVHDVQANRQAADVAISIRQR